MASVLLLYEASVLDELEVVRIRAAFAEETDDPGWRAKSDPKLFSPNVLL